MTSISEERKKVLRSKLKEMGNYGVQERSPEESPFYDQPTELERDLEKLQSDEPQEAKEEEPVARTSAAEQTAEPLRAKKIKTKEAGKMPCLPNSLLRNIVNATLAILNAVMVKTDSPLTVRSCSCSEMSFGMSVQRLPSPPTLKISFLSI